MSLALSKTARAQLAHLLSTYEGEHRATAVRATIRSTRSALTKAMGVSTTSQKISRAANMVKSLPPTVKPSAKPMTGDEILAAAEHLFNAGKLDAATAQQVVSAVHLGRLPEAAETLKEACARG